MEMELPWFYLFLILVSLFVIKSLLTLYSPNKLPPGPPSYPIITTIQWFRKSFSDIEPTLRHLRSIYGPFISLQIGRRKSIFIASHDLAHKALITHGSTFADRPPPPVASRYFSANQHNINSAAYGPLWRLLRRNLTSEILHPSRVKSYTHARKWVLHILKTKLKQDVDSGRSVPVMEHFQYAMFCLLVLMCFGDKLDEQNIRAVETVQRDLLLNFNSFNKLNYLPPFIGKILFRKTWALLYTVRARQERVLLPLVKARIEKKEHANAKTQKKKNDEEEEQAEEVVAYVDTLLDLTLPEEGGRKLNDFEIVGLCSEFLNAGTDTTSTALQWIIANLVKYPDIQVKLLDEISSTSDGGDEIKEEDLLKMPYLKAVVLEGLRRHPPGHFVLPHAVTEDIRVDGYVVPKDAAVNFMVAEMGLDPKVWEDPMEFKPERFMAGGDGQGFDITGTREIKMMPFGAGRRICPGLGLALLHLEYFVANLVKEFEFTAEEGDNVDLSEKQEFTIVMKNPLRARISARQG